MNVARLHLQKQPPITEPTSPTEKTVPIEILNRPSTINHQPARTGWRARMQARAGRLARIQKADVWAAL